jgi:hypothetical protein
MIFLTFNPFAVAVTVANKRKTSITDLTKGLSAGFNASYSSEGGTVDIAQ